MGVLTYIGWNILISSVAGAAVVVIFAGLDPVSSYTELYLGGMGSFLTQYFGIMFFCALIAIIYSESGAGLTIALGVAKLCLHESYSPARKRHIVIIALILMAALLEFAGVGASQVVFVLYPIALSLFKMADIPKKYIVAGILGGALGFANGLPGSPQPGNVIPMQILGTSSYAALVPGLIGAVSEIITMSVLVNLQITRDVKRGHHFEYGPRDTEFSDDKPRPRLIITLIPILLLVVLFNIVKMDINFALAITCIAAVLAFYPWLPGKDADGILRGKDVKGLISRGCTTSLGPVISICAVIGFSEVVQSTPAFNQVVDAISHWEINPYILLIITVSLMCMLCGGSATGQAIAVPIIAPIVNKMGVPLAAIHRVSAYAGAILDTMPYAGTVVMAHSYCDVKIKDGYPSVFMITVVATAVNACFTALICALFPGLAV